MNKRCRVCRRLKPLHSFYKCRRNKDGYQTECFSCTKKRNILWRKNNPEKVLEMSRKNYQHTRAQRLAYNKRYYKKNIKKIRNYAHERLMRNYGLTPAQYAKQLAEQKGACAICKKKPGVKRLHVDHCHDSQQVRGLLCSRCNCGLGMFLDQPQLLTAARQYLCRASIQSGSSGKT